MKATVLRSSLGTGCTPGAGRAGRAHSSTGQLGSPNRGENKFCVLLDLGPANCGGLARLGGWSE
jgi:hypothetical protein